MKPQKMEQFVTRNEPNSRPAGPGFSGLQKGHTSQSHMQPTNVQEASPPPTQYQSYVPIASTSANRTTAATKARVSTSRSGTSQPGRSGHGRDSSMSRQRNMAASADPKQGVPEKTWWDGSTVDGSVFSDSYSNEPQTPSHLRIHNPHNQRNVARKHPTQNETAATEQLQFGAIGENGMMDMSKTIMPRSLSTPSARARAGARELSQDSSSSADETTYQSSPDNMPSNTINHHRRRVTLRTTNPRPHSERTPYPGGHDEVAATPHEAYQTPSQGYDDAPTQDAVHLSVSERQGGHRRSTGFENIDSPIAVQNELDPDGTDEEHQMTPKASSKRTNRILFTQDSKGKNSLHGSAMPRSSMEPHHATPKKRQLEGGDYDDASLASMAYDELKSQEFDFDPAKAGSRSIYNPSKGTLPEKLEHFLGKDEEAQATFFTTMPIDDWNKSGDWFLQRFGDIMNRFRDARQGKRELVAGFENEIAEREASVRNKIRGIGKTLNDLKAEGEGLMRGKAIE